MRLCVWVAVCGAMTHLDALERHTHTRADDRDRHAVGMCWVVVAAEHDDRVCTILACNQLVQLTRTVHQTDEQLALNGPIVQLTCVGETNKRKRIRR